MLLKIFYRHEREKHQDIPADSGSNEEPSEEKNEDHKYNIIIMSQDSFMVFLWKT